MNKPIVQIKIKSVYGNTLIYPANTAAELLAKIAGTKTLSNPILAYAEQLGFQIQTVDAYVRPSKNPQLYTITTADQVREGDTLCFDLPGNNVTIERTSIALCDGAIGLYANDDTWISFYKPTDCVRIKPWETQGVSA